MSQLSSNKHYHSNDTADLPDPQFATAGQKAPDLQIWRIEDFKLNPVDPSQYGSFYSGDAYLILKTNLSKSNKKSWDLHFWLGKDSSADEQGAAAILAVQLDDFLGGEPIQYREVENYESPQFKSYFKSGIIYKEGGVKSGFNHVKTNDFSHVKRLLHIKGKRNVKAREVKFSWDSFNQGDSFIIDIGHLLIVFNAKESNKIEQMKANTLAKDIRDRERGGRARIEIVDGQNLVRLSENDLHQKAEEYAEILSNLEKLFGSPLNINDFGPATSDEIDATNSKINGKSTGCKMYHISDASGQTEINEVASSPLKQSLLLHEDTYFIDQGQGTKLYVWKGKLATRNERSQAMKYALDYISKNGYSNACQVEVNNDGAESTMFKQLFTKWTHSDEQNMPLRPRSSSNNGIAPSKPKQKFDASTLHSNPTAAAEARMPDDGQGEVIVWRVEDTKLHQIKSHKMGQFFTGDSYLILYTYNKNNKEAHIIYIWQGLKSPDLERGHSAALAVEMDHHFNGEPVQIRVEQGHEPRHFLEIFKGKFIIHNGGYDHQTKMSTESTETRMYHVKGNTTYNTKAVETANNASRLNSNDCFVVLPRKSSEPSFVWCGKGSNGDEREMAKTICKQLSIKNQPIEVLAEGHETKTFWHLLGGKTDYNQIVADTDDDPDTFDDYQGRLFECSNASGEFLIEEIINFQQDDLDTTDVMLLDAWECIFMWVGLEANEEEKMKSVQAASDYLNTHPAGRNPKTPLITIKQGYEPYNFTGWFQAWDPEMWGPVSWNNYVARGDTVASGKAISLEKESIDKRREDYNSRGDYQNVTEFYDYSLLKSVEVENLPPNVDVTKKENYLSDQEFVDVFGMDKKSFSSLKEWKKKDMKVKVGLF